MMRRWFVHAVQLLAVATSALARSSSGNGVLVVLEDGLQKENFSKFFGDLEGRGYELTFRRPKDETPRIIEDDVPQFAHVIFFSPTTKTYAKDITPQSLVALVEQNVNVLVTLSSVQTPLTSLATEFSLVLPPPHTPLISHFPARDGPHTIVPIKVPSAGFDAAPARRTTPNILSTNLGTVFFSGVPHALGQNPQLVPILRAPTESFAAEADEGSGDKNADALVDAAERGGEGLWAGGLMGVVTGFQAKNGARTVWAGGVEMFSDEFAVKEVTKGVKSGNAQLCKDISSWVFQESLVLRIDGVSHHRVNETSAPELYTVNDRAIYTVQISKYNPTLSKWEPYSGLRDLQLEFTMLDPHIRTALPAIRGKPGTYSVSFRVPDRHGVFKFVLDYKRAGHTFLYSATTVPVVPPRHDGYPRFLSAAWPYYAGAISTSVAFVLFSALWLGGDVSEKGSPKGKKKAGKTE